MNTIGTTPIMPQAVIPQAAPAVPLVAAQPAGVSRVAAAAPQPAPKEVKAEQAISLKSVEQQRFKAVNDIANIYVLGDRRFTIFKDVTGQYITRFTSLKDGKVTYVPEPELLKRGRNADPRVNIDA